MAYPLQYDLSPLFYTLAQKYAVEAIHNLLVDQRDGGSAILLISEDLDELFKLSNRLLVMYEGKIIKSFDIDNADINNVGLAMAGVIE